MTSVDVGACKCNGRALDSILIWGLNPLQVLCSMRVMAEYFTQNINQCWNEEVYLGV